MTDFEIIRLAAVAIGQRYVEHNSTQDIGLAFLKFVEEINKLKEDQRNSLVDYDTNPNIPF